MNIEIDLIIKRLKECIEASNLSYYEIGEKTGIAKSSINRYANGETKKIPVDAIIKIANIVHVDPLYIMGWDNSNSNILFTEKEKKLVTAYRNKPEMQSSVDKLLDIEDNGQVKGEKIS